MVVADVLFVLLGMSCQQTRRFFWDGKNKVFFTMERKDTFVIAAVKTLSMCFKNQSCIQIYYREKVVLHLFFPGCSF